MRRQIVFMMSLLAATAGCTAVSLERHTARQAMTGSDMRYQLVLDTLAKVIANPSDLPSLGTATDGQSFVTDTLSADARTALVALKGFNGETLSGSVTRSPQNTWTIDPVHTPDQIRALLLACTWVMTGIQPDQPPPGPEPDYTRRLQQGRLDYLLLKDFQVADDLHCLFTKYPRWFNIGCKQDVPKHCCYVAHHCDRYLWVCPEGIAGLSEFTLILTDVATVDPASLIGTALVGVTRAADAKPGAKALLTQSIPYRVEESAGHKVVDLLAPVVCYGDPDKNANLFFLACKPLWCDQQSAMLDESRTDLMYSDAMNAVLRNRPLQSAGPNSSYNYRQQEQLQMQMQQFQSFR